MATSLTAVGFFWSTLSLTAALLCCLGFYLPFWIQGRLLDKVDAYFSSFRRCNYPRVNPEGVAEIVEECGRYSSFWNIPSPWWQASALFIGGGSAVSLVVGIVAAAACCSSYVIQPSSTRFAGSVQFTAVLLMVIGVALFPIGWDNPEMRESCGDSSHIYRLGTCELSWSVYLLGIGISLLFCCFCLSFWAAQSKTTSYRM